MIPLSEVNSLLPTVIFEQINDWLVTSEDAAFIYKILERNFELLRNFQQSDRLRELREALDIRIWIDKRPRQVKRQDGVYFIYSTFDEMCWMLGVDSEDIRQAIEVSGQFDSVAALRRRLKAKRKPVSKPKRRRRK